MDISLKKELIKKYSPKSPVLKDVIFAFFVGGFICSLGEIIFYFFNSLLSVSEDTSSIAVTLILIFIAAVLTGFGIFDNIAKYAGAGTLVPVTGFSNAVVSEAMDSSSEGLILGVGAKIFNIAGPVILFGLCSGILYGIIYYISLFI
ncbi:MAG: stage V sporulation protein AC [Clostridia bacterium]|nr:stage V sporulation protein AC [Clostridia bacterium]